MIWLREFLTTLANHLIFTCPFIFPRDLKQNGKSNSSPGRDVAQGATELERISRYKGVFFIINHGNHSTVLCRKKGIYFRLFPNK